MAAKREHEWDEAEKRYGEWRIPTFSQINDVCGWFENRRRPIRVDRLTCAEVHGALRAYTPVIERMKTKTRKRKEANTHE